MLSAGGALGGVAVSLVAPHLFKTFLEWNIGMLAAYALATVVLFLAVPKTGWLRGRRVSPVRLCRGRLHSRAALARRLWLAGRVRSAACRSAAEFLRRGVRVGVRPRQPRLASLLHEARGDPARPAIRRAGKAPSAVHLLHARKRHRPGDSGTPEAANDRSARRPCRPGRGHSGLLCPAGRSLHLLRNQSGGP